MAKPFDLEKAKAGAKVLYDGKEVHYVGESTKPDYHVVECAGADGSVTLVYWVDKAYLTMAPVKVVKYANLYPRPVSRAMGDYTMYESKEVAEMAADRSFAIAVAIPVEVEE